MKTKWMILVLLVSVFAALQSFYACSTGSEESDDTDDTSSGAGDDTQATDDTAPADDTAVADDDTTAADDDTSGPPTMPSNHDTAWSCYICHEAAFNGAPMEPHSHTFTAPTDCITCHTVGTWTNSPSGPNPPADHNQTFACFTCHPDHHGKTWDVKQECFVCHAVPAK